MSEGPHKMEVLCLGMPGSGTAAMKSALETLGYKPTYHGFNIISKPSDMDAWDRLADARYGEGKRTLKREDFEPILGNYRAVTDAPAAFFADELIAAYPEAKVILVEKDVERWYHLFENHIIVNLWGPWADFYIDWVEPKISLKTGRVARKLLFQYFKAQEPYYVSKNARQVYKEHYERLRKRVPRERLLNFEVGSGWPILCSFLGKQVPETEFPKIEDEGALEAKIKEAQWDITKQYLLKIAWIFPIIAVALYAFVFL